MALKRRPSFDPRAFLAKVGEGRSINTYHKGQNVFSQGDPANAVFYIQSGNVKLTVVACNALSGACRRRRPCPILCRTRRPFQFPI
jgi:CRP-like cAMP-binding protein